MADHDTAGAPTDQPDSSDFEVEAGEPIDQPDLPDFEVVVGANGRRRVVDRHTGEVVRDYACYVDTVEAPDGTTKRVDRYTGETVADFDEFIVEYLNADGSIKIIDRLNGKSVEDYSEYFVMYSEYSGGEVVDRETGNAAHHYDEISGIVYLWNEDDTNLTMRAWDDYTEINDDWVDWKRSVISGDIIYAEPSIATMAPINDKADEACVWTPSNRPSEERFRQDLLKKCQGQRDLLERECGGEVLSSTEHRAKWWKLNDVGNCKYIFRPKNGPNTPVWPWRWAEPCDGFDDILSRINIFETRLNAHDYFEPLQNDYNDLEYIVAKSELRIKWIYYSPENSNEQPDRKKERATEIRERRELLVIDKLKWWDGDKYSGGYRFMPKIGANRYVWGKSTFERYPSALLLDHRIRDFAGIAKRGKVPEPKL
ncbi:MAG: hypothetical protein WCJ64_10740 [Rhodospirillaceae bacterium]